MYLKILLNKKIPLKQRIKNLLAYLSKRRGARIGWGKRFKKVFDLHPEYKKSVDKVSEREHIEYWTFFSKKINLSTLRVSSNISGTTNPKYIPEEVFVSDIEPSLNPIQSVEYLSYKSLYNRWFPGGLFPKDYFHNIEGEWLDQNLDPLSFEEIKEIAKTLSYPVTFKPNRDLYGGQGVSFPNNVDELTSKIRKNANFVVQEKIEQHPFFSKYNEHGLNTIRVCLYRSVLNNEIIVLSTALRMGVGGSLDNETAGGIVTLVKSNGELNGYAVDKYGLKYLKHPDTNLTFKGIVPNFSGLSSLSKTIAEKIFYARVFSLDFCLDSKGNWRVIEVNLFGQTIRFAQYAGQPFFGGFTDEVVEYCKTNHWALK